MIEEEDEIVGKTWRKVKAQSIVTASWRPYAPKWHNRKLT